jgi:hypothetical protein
MYAIIHLGTSDRIAESTSKKWLQEILTGYSIYKDPSNGSWRIFHPGYDAKGLKYKYYTPVEFEIMEIQVPTGSGVGVYNLE